MNCRWPSTNRFFRKVPGWSCEVSPLSDLSRRPSCREPASGRSASGRRKRSCRMLRADSVDIVCCTSISHAHNAFCFSRSTGWATRSRGFDCGQMDLIIVLGEQDVRLENRVDASNFELFCTPIINLFSRRADRVSLGDRASEFHVVIDRTRPIDFEVYQIKSVTGYGESVEEEQQIRPFYLARDLDLEGSAFFTVNRLPRVLSEKERRFGQATSYAGGEVFLSLVDSSDAPYRSDLRELSVKALCTNRHLPIQMAVGVGRTDFTLEVHAPVATVKCVTTPTPPRPPFAEGARAWRIINHLSLELSLFA